MPNKTLVALIALAGAISASSQPLPPAELPGELQKGGYILFIRHPQTNPDQADTDPFNLDNIKAQRQLTDQGRAQAKMLGKAFRAQRIPVEKVISSQFHRAQEAARLLNVGEVTTSVDVTEGGLVVPPRENERRAKALRKLLGTPPPAGKNLIIVSHRPNLQDAAGKDFADVSEGELVVFRPLAEGKFKIVARVTPQTWSTWPK
jgi:phosphohistidine phosphatase SixA